MTEIPGMPEQLARAKSGSDPRGVLTFSEPLPDPWQNAEDSTQSADFTRRLTHPRGFTRDATPVERQLLAAIGYTIPDGELSTVVTFPARAVRHRAWPQLEATQEVTP